MKQLPIVNTRKRKKHFDEYIALVDEEDFEWLSQWNWKMASYGKYCYCFRSKRENKSKIQHFYMHREIMKKHGLLEEGKLIDHIDRNPLNNQKSNLRCCTRAENSRNREKIKGGLSKYLGVSLHSGKYWSAQIKNNSKSIYLGSFKTEIEAALAYNEAAKKYHGEFANLNIVTA